MGLSLKYLVITIALGSITIFSCKKDSLNPKDSFSQEVAGEEAILTLSSSAYERVVSERLEMSGKEYYSKGVLEYKVNDQVEAIVDFGDSDKKVLVTKNGVGKKFDLKKNNVKSQYKKIIVSPVIKTNDCEYIVEGIIKYYDSKSGQYLATIDFGDGTCDEFAVKSWPAGKSKKKTWPAGTKTINLKDCILKESKSLFKSLINKKASCIQLAFLFIKLLILIEVIFHSIKETFIRTSRVRFKVFRIF